MGRVTREHVSTTHVLRWTGELTVSIRTVKNVLMQKTGVITVDVGQAKQKELWVDIHHSGSPSDVRDAFAKLVKDAT